MTRIGPPTKSKTLPWRGGRISGYGAKYPNISKINCVGFVAYALISVSVVGTIAILFVTAPSSAFSRRLERLRGPVRPQRQVSAHIPIRDEYIAHGDFGLDSGYRCGQKLMRLDVPPTAIFSCNNQMTLGLMRALVELRITCPQRVSVLGFDGFDWSAAFTPRLTTVAQPTCEMGKRAMEMLLAKMMQSTEASESEVEKVVVLKAELRVRDSTAPLPLDKLEH